MKIKQIPHKRKMLISEIKIPKSFLASTPSTDKFIYCNDFYEKNGFLDRDIILNQNGYLIDGYIAYLVAKSKGVEKVAVLQINIKVKYDQSKVIPIKIKLSLKERLSGKTIRYVKL